ncbi:MAG: PDZ domain-containing protein, partial [Candidatus Baltobacteraceae bacterium]
MRTVWQGFIAVLVLGGLSFTVLSLARPNDNGEFGFTLRRISNAQSIVVTVEPGGAAADAGIRKGDRIFPARDPAQRISVTTPEPGDRIVVRVNDPNSAPVVVIARASTQNVPAAAIAALVLTHLAFLFMGGLIAFRRPDDPAARSLATFLACFGVAMTLSTDLAQFSSTLGRFAAYLFVEAMFFVGAIAVLSFACRFPERAAGGWRLVIARSVVPLGVAGVLLSMTRLVLYYFTDFPWEHRSLLLLPYVLLYNFVLALAFASFIGAYRAMDGFDRIRMRWVLGTFGFGFSGLVVYFVMVSTGLNNPALDVVTFTIACIPIGLAYVILRHRIIDIGFVINRAVVYASVSLIVVGTFIVFEWLLAHVVEQRSNASA